MWGYGLRGIHEQVYIAAEGIHKKNEHIFEYITKRIPLLTS